MGRRREKNSIDWRAIERAYCENNCSIRALGRQFKVCERGIRKKADAENWARTSATPPQQSPHVEVLQNAAALLGSVKRWAIGIAASVGRKG